MPTTRKRKRSCESNGPRGAKAWKGKEVAVQSLYGPSPRPVARPGSPDGRALAPLGSLVIYRIPQSGAKTAISARNLADLKWPPCPSTALTVRSPLCVSVSVSVSRSLAFFKLTDEHVSIDDDDDQDAAGSPDPGAEAALSTPVRGGRRRRRRPLRRRAVREVRVGRFRRGAAPLRRVRPRAPPVLPPAGPCGRAQRVVVLSRLRQPQASQMYVLWLSLL